MKKIVKKNQDRIKNSLNAVAKDKLKKNTKKKT